MNRSRYRLRVDGVQDLAGRLKRLRDTPEGRERLDQALREQATVVERLTREHQRRQRRLRWTGKLTGN